MNKIKYTLSNSSRILLMLYYECCNKFTRNSHTILPSRKNRIFYIRYPYFISVVIPADIIPFSYSPWAHTMGKVLPQRAPKGVKKFFLCFQLKSNGNEFQMVRIDVLGKIRPQLDHLGLFWPNLDQNWSFSPKGLFFNH